MSWVRDRHPAPDESGIRMRYANLPAYRLDCEFGEERQNVLPINILIKPRWQIRRFPLPQCLSLFYLGSKPTSFGSRAVGGNAPQLCLLQKVFPIH